MDASPEKYVARLTEISNRKYKLLQDMLVLTQEQARSIDQSSIESLQKLVDSKQAKINEIDKIDEEFGVYFQRLKQQLRIQSLDELGGQPGIQGTKELQESVRRIVGLMDQIFEIEKQNNQKANVLLDSLANEVKKLNQSKKVTLAYNAGPKILPSYFIDKKK